MSTRIIDEAARVLADPLAYTDETTLHRALSHLRSIAPVSWVDAPNYSPFWAITKLSDIMVVERANEVFTNSPRPVLTITEGDQQQAAMGSAPLSTWMTLSTARCVRSGRIGSVRRPCAR